MAVQRHAQERHGAQIYSLVETVKVQRPCPLYVLRLVLELLPHASWVADYEALVPCYYSPETSGQIETYLELGRDHPSHTLQAENRAQNAALLLSAGCSPLAALRWLLTIISACQTYTHYRHNYQKVVVVSFEIFHNLVDFGKASAKYHLTYELGCD